MQASEDSNQPVNCSHHTYSSHTWRIRHTPGRVGAGREERRLWHAITSPSSPSFPDTGGKQSAEVPEGRASHGPQPCSHQPKFSCTVAPPAGNQTAFCLTENGHFGCLHGWKWSQGYKKLGDINKNNPFMWYHGPWSYHHRMTVMLLCRCGNSSVLHMPEEVTPACPKCKESPDAFDTLLKGHPYRTPSPTFHPRIRQWAQGCQGQMGRTRNKRPAAAC